MAAVNGNILAHLDRSEIEAAYAAAPGNEIASGKFLSRESSAALAANAFGLFLRTPELLPPMPGCEDLGWPAQSVTPEAIVRFPWAGGRHPCLDMLIETRSALIGVESKRYEPFRPKARPELSSAYWRPVWGSRMAGYQKIRDQIKDGSLQFAHLDAAQLVKHALGLRSAGRRAGKVAALTYVYAEPDAWPDGRPISRDQILRHRQEIDFFKTRTRDDEVRFIALPYSSVLTAWSGATDPRVSAHANAVRRHFTLDQVDGAACALEPLWRSDEPETCSNGHR